MLLFQSMCYKMAYPRRHKTSEGTRRLHVTNEIDGGYICAWCNNYQRRHGGIHAAMEYFARMIDRQQSANSMNIECFKGAVPKSGSHFDRKLRNAEEVICHTRQLPRVTEIRLTICRSSQRRQSTGSYALSRPCDRPSYFQSCNGTLDFASFEPTPFGKPRRRNLVHR